jgi:hypothetical protein
MIRAAAMLALAVALAATGSVAAERNTRRQVVEPPSPERFVTPPPQGNLPQRNGSSPQIRAGIEQSGEEGRVRIIVRVIAAQPGSAGRDPRLAALESNLDTLPLRYGTFKLVEEKSFDLDWKIGAQMELPGSRSLLVTPRQLAPDGRIRVHLEVLGAHPEHSRTLHTDYSVARGGTLLVGGYRLDPTRPEAGVLLIAITQVLQR